MTPSPPQPDPASLSKVEGYKEASRGLLGSIAEEIESPAASFSEESVQLLKHHGTYQQDNRDLRSQRRKAGLDRDYRMMARTKTPGGRMTPEQYLLCDELADRYGQGDLRITSRQGFQFHGVLKGNLRSLIHDLNHLQRISTQGACGDVVRNVMAPALADLDPRFGGAAEELIDLAREISDRFLPKSSSYYDLWLDDERVEVAAEGGIRYKTKEPSRAVEEPLYGARYLPRKFKIGIATDFDNSVDVFTQDCGIIAVLKDGAVDGYEVLAGGGLGHAHGKEETYPRLGTALAFVGRGQLPEVIEAVIKVQRDFGDRTERRQARLKYTIDRMGWDAFRAKVEEYLGSKLPAPRGVIPSDQPDYLGWTAERRAGLWSLGLWVENGRVRDFDGARFRSGLRELVGRFRPDSIRLTPHHNIVLTGLRDGDRDAIHGVLREFGLPTVDDLAPLRRREMACPALPLCGLALAEAERALPAILDAALEAGAANEDIVIRMTGCPNSCARPETSEIGIIGRAPGKYHVYTGGDRAGSRMNALTLEDVTADQLPSAVRQLTAAWIAERPAGESFGDWACRMTPGGLRGRVSL